MAVPTQPLGALPGVPAVARGASWAAALRPLLAFAVLPNLFFWALGTRLYLMRPLVNVDYLLLGVLAPFLPRKLVAAGLGLELGLDAVVNVAPAFHFQFVDFLRSLIDVVHLDLAVVLPGAAAVVLCCAAGAWVILALAGPAPRRAHALALLALTLVICGLDIANGTSLLPLPVARSFLSFNLANSAAAKTLLALRVNLRRSGPGRYEPLPVDAAASAPLLAAARDLSRPLPGRQLGVVNVESWGLFLDPALAAALVAPLTSPEIEARYQVELGQVPFHGVTIDGEFRELCGVRLLERGSELPECLPKILKARGYETVALHGFTSQFYDRQAWYPKLGFDRILFAQDLRKRGLSRTCGSGFSGLCDVEVAQVMADELAAGTAEHPRLVYWMTLNSHVPLSAADAQGSNFDCAAGEATRKDPAICLHAQVLSRALAAVARVALDPRLLPTELVVVGDHAPPSLSLAQRNRYDQEKVPFVRLIPRQ